MGGNSPVGALVFDGLQTCIDLIEMVGELLGLREAGELAQGEAHDHLHLGVGGEAGRILGDDGCSLGILCKLLALVVDGLAHCLLLGRDSVERSCW